MDAGQDDEIWPEMDDLVLMQVLSVNPNQSCPGTR